MQQQARLACDPALISFKRQTDQTEVFVSGQVKLPFFPVGTSVVGFHDKAIAAHHEAVLGIGEGHIKRRRARADLHGRPGAGCSDRQTGGDATSQPKGQAEAEHQAQ